MGIIEILNALQAAPQLMPKLIQVLTDANKVVEDFNDIVNQIKQLQVGTQPPKAA
jgi:ribonuclease HI